MKKLNLQFGFAVMFLFIAIACSITLNVMNITDEEVNMYKFILACSTLISMIIWIHYMIKQNKFLNNNESTRD